VETLAAEDKVEPELMPGDGFAGTDTAEEVTVEIAIEPAPLATFFMVPEEVVVEPSLCKVVVLSLVVGLSADGVGALRSEAVPEDATGSVGASCPADGRRMSFRPCPVEPVEPLTSGAGDVVVEPMRERLLDLLCSAGWPLFCGAVDSAAIAMCAAVANPTPAPTLRPTTE
jgi:hypothetical protein